MGKESLQMYIFSFLFLSISHRILMYGWMTQRTMALWWCHLELGSNTFHRTLLTNWQEPSPGYPSVLSGGKVSVIWLSHTAHSCHCHKWELHQRTDNVYIKIFIYSLTWSPLISWIAATHHKKTTLVHQFDQTPLNSGWSSFSAKTLDTCMSTCWGNMQLF